MAWFTAPQPVTIDFQFGPAAGETWLNVSESFTGWDYKEYRRFTDVAFGPLTMDYTLVPPLGETAEQMLTYWQARLQGQNDVNGNPLGVGFGVRNGTQDWLAFAMRFVASSTLKWQQTSRTGFDEILKGAFRRLLDPSQV